MASDILRFFRAWMFDPLRVASITPSGAALARLMVSEIAASTGSVIELGPGTGVFTHALVRQGVSEDKLILVEKGAEFAAMLGQRFPRARLLCIDAAEIGAAIGPNPAQAGAVVSGLPLLSMPAKMVSAILAGSFAHLRDDGCFYQFTYGPRCPVPGKLLEGLGLEATRMGQTLRNVPPAAVYRIARRPVPLQASPARPPGIAMTRERA
ncbi:phospholipid methyltransferase [Mesorhizobium caraganae]|uniref:class I SAM-dependent methyltransferase n=1 Tax=Mesorhizobium caraganae TaxID=483206 RepID=UPI00177D3896|nr:SAM-dependent methyltransferase [Mesorhizobium caraganae]MBM2712981.1 phospholipid methyltransferase [Mesorhizobium caraganae]